MRVVTDLHRFKRLSGLIEEAQEKKRRIENIIFHAPENTKSIEDNDCFKVFLAGTIDVGNSVDWQKELETKIKKQDLPKQVVVFNPRRDDWPEDGSSEMHKQVNWELEHMEKSNMIVMNIVENSKSPISLLELGIHSQDEPKKIVVFCKKGFYRYDNVKIVCERYDVPLIDSNDVDDIYKEIVKRIK